jgi:bifunctional non-homologous end joining protein LigD
VLIGLYEIKLDGYRALAIKSGGKVQLRSRNDNDFTERYSSIAAALRTVPDETVLDGGMDARQSSAALTVHCSA